MVHKNLGSELLGSYITLPVLTCVSGQRNKCTNDVDKFEHVYGTANSTLTTRCKSARHIVAFEADCDSRVVYGRKPG